MVRLRACLATLGLLAWAGAAGAAPQPDPLPSPGVTEDAAPLPVDIQGHHYALNALIVRPPGMARLPVALITHGTADGDPRNAGMDWLRGWAHDLANRGWLAVAVMRRGYGQSEGDMFDDAGTCAAPEIGRYLDANADDLAAVLQAVARRPDADMDRVIAIGDPAGGAAVLDLSARGTPHVSAVVNVSGGLGRRESAFHPTPGCDAFTSDLIWNFARFGSTSPMPTLWLYAENDSWFRPGLVSRMHAAYTGSGGKAKLEILPPFGGDGHALFYAEGGRQLLLPELDQFLREHRLPTWNATTFDPLLAHLSPADRGSVQAYLVSQPSEKALALGPHGGAYWYQGGSTLTKARNGALEYCRKQTGTECRLAAENYDLAPTAATTSPLP
jgi:dienelactone hydrolase